VLLLLNPTDAYRLVNLGGTAGAISGMGSGMGGVADIATLAPAALLAALLAWAAIPLAAAILVFSRREL
jgi:Cu-processing system permease protein